MIVQMMIVRDTNDETLTTPRWTLTRANYDTIQAEIIEYLENNPGHYVIPVQTSIQEE